MTTPDQHRRLQELVEAALDQPLDERTAYIFSQCHSEPDLLKEAKDLLEAYSDEEPSAEAERIGPYRLIREIGSGGMGVVYLAEREGGYHRKVAMKVMRRGMDTDFFLARFLKEREILGALDHPGVVRIVDAGSTLDGRPYLVMDYVDGMRIDKYCTYHKLTVVDRVRIFIKVCSAVQHAHRNLIVHRDLKPSNILVTPEGEPKLLDFGIAKVVDENDERTQLTIPIMTRQYASPEQVKGKRITTSCDVYALGLIFYEMLTGHRPYDLKDKPVTEVERIVCDIDPPQPSASITENQSRSALRGDLDRIVMMALRKEPERRYGSVEMMATDLTRFLDGRPVSAQPDTWHYRAAKYVQRNRTAVGVLSLIGAMLVGGTGGIIWQARIASSERLRGHRESLEARKQSERAEEQAHLLAAARDRAEARLADVHALANALLFDLPASIRDLPGSTEGQRLLLTKAVQYYERLVKESSGADPALSAELAQAYEQLGRLQGGGSLISLGDTAAAIESQQKALAIRRQLTVSQPSNVEFQKALGASYLCMAGLHHARKQSAEELTLARQAIALFEQLGPAGLDGKAAALQAQGSAWMTQGNLDGALASFRQSTAIRQARGGSPVPAGESREREAEVLELQGRFQDSAALVRANTAAFDDAVAQYPNDIRYQVDQIGNRRRLARLAERTGDLTSALANYSAALEAQTQLAARDPQNARLVQDRLLLRLSHANAILNLGQPNESLVEYREAAASAAALLKRDPLNRELKAAHSSAGWGTAQSLLEQGHPSEAARMFAEAATEARSLVPGDASSQLTLALAALGIGRIDRDEGRLDQAAAQFRKAIELLSTGSPQDYKTNGNLAVAHNRLGEVLRLTKHPAEARAAYQRATTLAAAMLAVDANNNWAAGLQAEAYSGEGAIEEASANWQAAARNYEAASLLDDKRSTHDRKDVRARAGLADSKYHLCVARFNLGDAAAALKACDAAIQAWNTLAAAPHHLLALGLEKEGEIHQTLSAGSAEEHKRACSLFAESLDHWHKAGDRTLSAAAQDRVAQRVQSCTTAPPSAAADRH